MNDVRFACRQLLKNPGFTAVAMLTLALGIGANTAIFSLINIVLFRPLPAAQPQQIVSVGPMGKHGLGPALSYPNYCDLRDRNEVFSGLFATRYAPEFESRRSQRTHLGPARLRELLRRLGCSSITGQDDSPG